MKKGAVKVIWILVLAVVLLVILFIGYSEGWGNSIMNIYPFVTSENTEAVVNHCEVLCKIDKNQSMFCHDKSRPLPLRLGGGKKIDGSCAAISDLGIADFKGVSECNYLSCGNYEPASCYSGSKKVDCKEFMSKEALEALDKKEVEVDKVALSIKRSEDYLGENGCELQDKVYLDYAYSTGDLESHIGISSDDVEMYKCKSTSKEIKSFDYDYENCVYDLGNGTIYLISTINDRWQYDSSVYSFMDNRFYSKDEIIQNSLVNRLSTFSGHVCGYGS